LSSLRLFKQSFQLLNMISLKILHCEERKEKKVF
jgi:hypothetical protein